MTRAAGMLLAAVVTLTAWVPLLGWRVLWVLPAVVLAVAALAAGRLPGRPLAAAYVAWPFVALTAGGAPKGWLWPTSWDTLVLALSDGAREMALLVPGERAGDIGTRSLWLLGAGAAFVTAAALAAPREAGPLRAVTAFTLLATPWLVATAIRQTDESAWPGAVLLLAGLLWFAPRRAAVPVLALGTAAALVAASAAHAVGPRSQWIDFDDMVGREPQFQTLNTTQSYGPINDRRSGATMLEITSPRPALWRMQVLERYGWRGWEVGGGVERPDLPEPAAERVDVQVTVRGLRDSQVVSPGRIRSVEAAGKVDTMPGDARRLIPQPRQDDTYRVRADMVRVDPAALRAAPPATDHRLAPYTSLWFRWGGERLAGRLGEYGAYPHVSPGLERFMRRVPAMRDVLNLSQQLAAGARTQYEVVERVERYLTEGGRFRYTTDVPEMVGFPILDFLLYDRAGYCQHFAGAAALLLRLAGVPTRVAAGFATGKSEDGLYKVRDTDAHAWIEVYFEGQGWVPFDPTPAADAEVAAEVDPLTPPAPADSGGVPRAVPVAGIGLVLLLGAAFALRRRRGHRARRHGELLERLAARTGAPVTPGTTLTELRGHLERIGPRVAEIAAEAERARFAPGPAPPGSRTRVVRALVADVGTPRAVLLLASAALLRPGEPGSGRGRGQGRPEGEPEAAG
ncbi:transglutaminase-like domain-containing protein [Spirillospora sp. NPDC029432]|uniref:transglutaminase-like domain-containing protein n=1 Tax=Spirillospora sp. NPDC029432 TaxID=3154599 RepID=UPI00345622AB